MRKATDKQIAAIIYALTKGIPINICSDRIQEIYYNDKENFDKSCNVDTQLNKKERDI